MKNPTLVFTFVNLLATAAFANDFCAPQAIAAAQALANSNGSVSEVGSANFRDGKSFTVILSEEGVGQDIYNVKISAGHDCIVLSLKVIGQPTLRP